MTYGMFLPYVQWNKSSLEHHREGSDNGLSSRKIFLEHSIFMLLKNEDYS